MATTRENQKDEGENLQFFEQMICRWCLSFSSVTRSVLTTFLVENLLRFQAIACRGTMGMVSCCKNQENCFYIFYAYSYIAIILCSFGLSNWKFDSLFICISSGAGHQEKNLGERASFGAHLRKRKAITHTSKILILRVSWVELLLELEAGKLLKIDKKLCIYRTRGLPD